MSKVDDKSASASSEPSSGSNAVTDDEIAAWKAMFASSNPKREEGVLDKYNFIAVVLKVRLRSSSLHSISEEDLINLAMR
jgi:hypothetical protein